MRNISLTLCFFTTFSGFALAQTEYELLFAHFGDGELAEGRIISQFILLNPDETIEAHATITIKGDNGDPLSGIDLDGQTLPEGTLDVTIPACGMRILTTDGEGPVRVGSATVTSDKPLTGVINFGGAFGAAGVGASARQSRFVAAMIRNASTDTGLAIMNPGPNEVTVDLQLFDKDGNLLATATLTIPTIGKRALFFDEISWQPEPGVTLDLSTFEGLIKGTTTGGEIAATVIQTRTGEFVTMPVGRVPVTITVTSAADDGPGTLRRALFFADPGDIITFDPEVFPPNTPTTITLTSGLPELSQGSLTIDASNAGVILDGSEMIDPKFQYGLHILSNGNTIRGLQIVGFPFAGIALERGASHNLIGGDRGIGTGPQGQGNRISGNGSIGIGVWDEGTSFNTIQGNSIFRHTRDGIHSNGASYNLIRDNVIGRNGSGIYLSFVADGHNTVTANFIGTDASGETPLDNRQSVLVDHTGYNVIGPGNLIAHNRGTGIRFREDTPTIRSPGTASTTTAGPSAPPNWADKASP